MRRAKIYYQQALAGLLTETDEGYTFRYFADYLASPHAQSVSLTLPVSDVPYRSAILFPFFDGLIPEGWLLDVALRNTDISALDRMALLLLCCRDCIGAVSVVPLNDGEEVAYV